MTEATRAMAHLHRGGSHAGDGTSTSRFFDDVACKSGDAVPAACKSGDAGLVAALTAKVRQCSANGEGAAVRAEILAPYTGQALLAQLKGWDRCAKVSSVDGRVSS